LPSPDVTTVAGSLIAGKYRVLKIIGSGGMGTVWEGIHMKLGTRVAIKLIRPQFAQQAEARARFEIEARAAAKLSTTTPCTSTTTASATRCAVHRHGVPGR